MKIVKKAYTALEFERHKRRHIGGWALPWAAPGGYDKPPPLYEPVLLGFAPIAFRLRGFERVGRGNDAYTVVQEWHVEAA